MTFVREPLVHFLLLGAALFVVFEVAGRGGGAGADGGAEAGRRIVVTAGQVAVLRRNYEIDNGRAPTAAELDRAVDLYVREEILVREARAQGLDRDDTIVRRRLVQKMEFAVPEPPPPTDEQLRAFLQEHPEEARPTTRGPSSLFFNRLLNRRTAATVVDIGLPSALSAKSP